MRWTGDLDLARELLPNAEAALGLDARLRRPDGDGFLEYQQSLARRHPQPGLEGLARLGEPPEWRLAEPPIALAEVQAYAFAAAPAMAELYARLGDTDEERDQRAWPSGLRRRTSSSGWRWRTSMDRSGRWALTARQAPIETVTSNPGHALWAGLLRGDAARLTVRGCSPTTCCAAGASAPVEPRARFNPMSYHNGSVWPHDNALIALGHEAVGADDAALRGRQPGLRGRTAVPAPRLPELWCGFAATGATIRCRRSTRCRAARRPGRLAARFMLLQALLGLEVDAFERRGAAAAAAADWLGRVSVRKLRVAGRRSTST